MERGTINSSKIWGVGWWLECFRLVADEKLTGNLGCVIFILIKAKFTPKYNQGPRLYTFTDEGEHNGLLEVKPGESFWCECRLLR